MTRRLWIRADASETSGMGHVMRMIALAERSLERGLAVQFVVRPSDLAVTALESRGFSALVIQEQAPTDWLGFVATDDVVVFDGYSFGSKLMQDAGTRGARVSAVDDLGYGRFPVNVLLNQNPIGATQYETLTNTLCLFGPRYSLIRQEFLAHRRNRGRDAPRTLLVTMGGSDVAELTEVLIRLAPTRRAFDRLSIVVGPGGRYPRSIRRSTDVEIVSAPPRVAETFGQADAALSAAGSTTWELLAMGIPTALVQVVENQRDIGPGVERAGAGLFLGGPEALRTRFGDITDQLADRSEREKLSTAALALVDGRGADRYLDALLNPGTSDRAVPRG